ncbi:hypothetical protein [Micromonospora sp. NPDC048842]|uniref:hypothetical protein n=1 Tax=unclassified Micromonospora TaxID=2617518 RepID=UPI0033D334FB
MTRIRESLQLALPFLWLGMVLAISFIEAPLKFRAPGITLPLGLGIGRLVFRGLNIAEIALLAALTITVLGSAIGPARWSALGGLWLILLTQAVVLRPLLDRRAQLIIDGHQPPPSVLHLGYIGLEVLKVAILVLLGASLIARLTR